MSTSTLQDETICFTGTLTTQTRAQASKAAREHGASVASSLTKKVTMLVVGPSGGGAKVKQAEAKGIRVCSEEEFNVMIGLEDDNEDNDGTNDGQEEQEKEEEPPKKKTKKKDATTATTSPPKKSSNTPTKKSPPAASVDSPASSTTSGGRHIMTAVRGRVTNYSVFEDYDVKLMFSDSLNANSNKFYKLQILKDASTENYMVATNWGRLGEPGKSQLKSFSDVDGAVNQFCKVFRSKTRNEFGAEPFVRYGDKYQIVETTLEDDDGSDDGAALGRLTEGQIHKGQEVLKQIRTLLERNEQAAASGKRKRTSANEKTSLGSLSNDFYSLIPTTSGRQRPPQLDNLDIVTEKEGLLEFWLRMGFEDVSDANVTGSPIEGVLDLAVPSTLVEAASKITDKYSIETSRERGEELVESNNQTFPNMNKELFAAILLYTGNSIYAELNRCLRLEWKKVPKYWRYLRLLLEGIHKMPTKPVTLWRGIAADLYDEYEEGKVVTWWTVSSCTSEKSVAENFMNQLGSSSTLLTLHTKTACDISLLSFFSHEKESLLKPGTKLRVLKRKRNGKVAEIEVEEVLDDDDDDDEQAQPKAEDSNSKQ